MLKKSHSPHCISSAEFIPSPTAENQLTQSHQQGNFCKTRATLPKRHGFQPSYHNRWQDAGVAWVLTPQVALEHLVLVGAGAGACPAWLERSWGPSFILPFLLVFLPSSLLAAMYSTLAGEKLRKTCLVSA